WFQTVNATSMMLTANGARRSGGSASEVGGGSRPVLDGQSVGGDAAGGGPCRRDLQDGGALLAEGVGWGATASKDPAASAAAVARGAEEISRGLAKGEPLTAIAARLGRSVSTVSRVLKRNTTPVGYRGAATGQSA